MKDKVLNILQEIETFKSIEETEIESFRVKILGKKGVLNELFKMFKNIPEEEKKWYGQQLNAIKTNALKKISSLQTNKKIINSLGNEDYTKQGEYFPIGARHPISLVRKKIIDIFLRIGFQLSDGPEIEDDWHNFTALNLPEYHPARDMQDTFFIEKNPDWLLRTHTSSVQIRYMEKNKPPIRVLSPGRVYRNEAISARSHCIFHQIEGLYVDNKVSFTELKQTLTYFTSELFGTSKIRLRPSYFPFTEPSAEVDVYWGLNTEADYRITKGTGWLEILGCGMVDPNVLKNTGIDPDIYSGYAFGMGIERIAMLLYQIEDIRMFYENDMRFLKQFCSEH